MECREKFGLARDEIALFIRRTEAIVAEDRLTLSGVALVSMMESSDLRNHYDAPAFWLLHGPRFRSIFGQRQMSSGLLLADLCFICNLQ